MSEIFEVMCKNPVGDGLMIVASKPTLVEAEERLAELEDFQRRRNRSVDYWIERVDTTGAWEVPPRPTPRERFHAMATKTSGEFGWHRVAVEVHDRVEDRVVARYERNYDMLDTFEPFRQGDRLLALVSPSYTATSILDLATGEILGGEEPDPDGFCPVGFYVPDWHDVWPDYLLPGSHLWAPHHEWPHGDFGFVWGCVWGDDSIWKVQYLDLSRAGEGVVVREERFGYQELVTRRGVPGSEFIRVSNWSGGPRVTFHVPRRFDLATGRKLDEDGGPILGRRS